MRAYSETRSGYEVRIDGLRLVAIAPTQGATVIPLPLAFTARRTTDPESALDLGHEGDMRFASAAL